MSIKIQFLFCNLDRFPENTGAVSDEQGEIFHQDIKVVEQQYQGRWDSHMMADYCWIIMRGNITSEHKRRSKKNNVCPRTVREISCNSPLFTLTEHYYFYFIVLWG